VVRARGVEAAGGSTTVAIFPAITPTGEPPAIAGWDAGDQEAGAPESVGLSFALGESEGREVKVEARIVESGWPADGARSAEAEESVLGESGLEGETGA
jgi:hypothetical protein